MFQELPLAGLVSGTAAVLGHNYPFYIGFKGGKGLASFGGFILALSPIMFLCMLTGCVAIAFILNYGCMLALSAAALFPIIVGISYGSFPAFLVAAVCGTNVFLKHTQNLKRVKNGEETKFRTFISKYVLKLTKKQEQ